MELKVTDLIGRLLIESIESIGFIQMMHWYNSWGEFWYKLRNNQLTVDWGSSWLLYATTDCSIARISSDSTAQLNLIDCELVDVCYYSTTCVVCGSLIFEVDGRNPNPNPEQ